MNLRGCAREPELSALIARGHWPQASSDELRTHVTGCRACRELILLKQAFAGERSRASTEARLEPPGVLWWKAQLRRRNAAIERMGKPLIGAQVFALLVCLVGLAGYVFTQARRGFDWLAWLGQMPAALRLRALIPESLGKSPWELLVAVSIVALVAALGGLVVHLATTDRGPGVTGR